MAHIEEYTTHPGPGQFGRNYSNTEAGPLPTKEHPYRWGIWMVDDISPEEISDLMRTLGTMLDKTVDKQLDQLHSQLVEAG